MFARNPSSGALSFRSCVRGTGTGPCTAVNHVRALNGPSALVMSPDGRHLYVAAEEGDALSVWRRNASSGALSFASCRTTNIDGEGVCVELHSGFLDKPVALAISPDGDEVYVAGDTQSSVGSLARDQDSGVLGDFHCLGAAPECADVPDANAIVTPSSLAVSRDGRYVYSASRGGNSIAWFGYDNATDELEYKDCYGATNAGGCISIGNSSALNGPLALAVSTTDAQLYVASSTGNAIGAFTRNRSSGALSFLGCDGATNVGPCAAIGNGNALTGPAALAVSPFGGRVYGAAANGDAIASFARVGTGNTLSFLGCLGATSSGPCASSGNASAFNSPEAIAVSPDGRHLYVAAAASGALTVLGVARPACSPVSALTPFNTAIRVRLACGDPDGGDAVRSPSPGRRTASSASSIPSAARSLFTPESGVLRAGRVRLHRRATPTAARRRAPRSASACRRRRRPVRGASTRRCRTAGRSIARTPGSCGCGSGACRATRRCRSAARRRSGSVARRARSSASRRSRSGTARPSTCASSSASGRSCGRA